MKLTCVKDVSIGALSQTCTQIHDEIELWLEEKKWFLRTANFGLVDYTNVEFSLNINKVYRRSHCPALIKHYVNNSDCYHPKPELSCKWNWTFLSTTADLNLIRRLNIAFSKYDVAEFPSGISLSNPRHSWDTYTNRVELVNLAVLSNLRRLLPKLSNLQELQIYLEKQPGQQWSSVADFHALQITHGESQVAIPFAHMLVGGTPWYDVWELFDDPIRFSVTVWGLESSKRKSSLLRFWEKPSIQQIEN